ncbi:unnamed protein product [Adineta ricciae]|uniref:Uncharacterized protein n=1 Tax=Adineta ricciae TaxID=249248 RepID=A0A814Q620_ADIRI|nr:unnamed protein product [Adineta ricciae]CAF1115822.1 unnamed protein product [Adineta ricciae]
MDRLDSLGSVAEEPQVLNSEKICMRIICGVTIALIIMVILLPAILILLRSGEIKDSSDSTIRPPIRLIITKAISTR